MIFPENIYYNQFLALFIIILADFNIALAAPGVLTDTPLFTKNSSQPNVFFEVDDSGSMDFDILTKKHWEACAYISGANTCGIVQSGLYRGLTDNGTTQDFSFISNNNDNAYLTSSSSNCSGVNKYSFVRRTLEVCSTISQQYDWRVKSSSVNVMYFNPEITYDSWNIGDGAAMVPATFNAVRSDPQVGSAGYSLTRNLNGFVYYVAIDSHGFTGSRPSSGATNRQIGSNGLIDLWDEHIRYTVNASSITVERITYTGNTESIANMPSLGTAETSVIQQNIANWYQYARRRSFVAKSAIAKVISAKPAYRYGLNFINNTSFPYNGGTTSFVEVPVDSFGTREENAKLINGLFSLDWPPQGTPLREGLERVGNYFDNTDGRTDPIIEQCQQNYSILFTDGYWNGSPASSIGDVDGDGKTTTVADIAKFYYDKDLSGFVNNSADPVAGHQHMETYTVAFGLRGLLTDTDADGWPGNAPGLAGNSTSWGDPFTADSPEKIDDLWHAAFNSNGKFVSASTPMAVADALEAALSDIGNKVGSAASVTFNGNALSANSSVYVAQFKNESTQWSGDLLSHPLDSTTGSVVARSNWSATTQLDARNLATNPRNIFTYNGTEGKPFVWANLTIEQQADLKKNPDTTDSDATQAEARLNYLRGDRSNEGSSGSYAFRERSTLLGDIVHSDPFYVGVPNSYWPNAAPFPTGSSDSYNAFRAGTAASRDGVVYVGANDGMLHGFKSSDGSEVMAYIPNSIFSDSASSGLHYLTDPDYAHRYYVDMPLSIADAYIRKSGTSSPSWHTVLIGGGRAGSKGLFALDITDPSQFGTTSYIQDQVIWEFDNTDDADLGFTYSKPTIGLMNNERWAAIFGNGYNNTGSGDAALYIVFLDVGDGGSDGIWDASSSQPEYIKIMTDSGTIVASDCNNVASSCNGLSTPQPVDLNGDRVIDRIYAGDLKGNMWAFDVKDVNTSNWGVAYPNTSSISPVPLFTATHHESPVSGNPVPITSSSLPQPITSKPILVKHPNKLGGEPDVLVFFGTGQYLVDSDVPATDIQSFYGVWDNGTDSLTPSNLVEQELLSGTFTNVSAGDVTNQVRVLTDNDVDYGAGKKGWFINLPSAGERSVVDADIRGGLVYFNTWIPSDNPCDPGGSGFLMAVKQINGGSPDKMSFDFDGDGDVDSNDRVTSAGTDYAPSGAIFNHGQGLPSSSSFLGNKQYTSGTDGNTERTVPDLDDLGRLSWEELRK